MCFWKALAIYNGISTAATIQTFAELINVGTVYHRQGKLQLARSLYLQAESTFHGIPEDQKDMRDLATLYNNLGLCLEGLGDGDALQTLQFAHKIREALLGPAHPMTLQTHNHIANATSGLAATNALRLVSR